MAGSSQGVHHKAAGFLVVLFDQVHGLKLLDQAALLQRGGNVLFNLSRFGSLGLPCGSEVARVTNRVAAHLLHGRGRGLLTFGIHCFHLGEGLVLVAACCRRKARWQTSFLAHSQQRVRNYFLKARIARNRLRSGVLLLEPIELASDLLAQRWLVVQVGAKRLGSARGRVAVAGRLPVGSCVAHYLGDGALGYASIS